MPRASAGCKSVRCGLRNHVQLRHREVSFRRKTLHDRIKSRQLFSRNRSEEHTSELQSQSNLVCRLLLEKKKNLEPAILPSAVVSQLALSPPGDLRDASSVHDLIASPGCLDAGSFLSGDVQSGSNAAIIH